MKPASSRSLIGAALIVLSLVLPAVAQESTFSLRGDSANPRVQLQFPTAPASTYMIDDGTAENSIGLQAGGTFMALNSFPTVLGSNIINSISIAWGGAAPVAALNGLPYTAVLWSDPNGDGSPTDAAVLAMAPGVIASNGTNTFITTPIPPTVVLTPNFFVGFVITHAAGLFPAAFDQTAPTFSNRSFIAAGSDPNNLSGAITIESAGLVGNWLIRADAVPEPSTWAMLGLGASLLAAGKRFSRRSK